MVRLSVNVDHVATLRQARRATEPDPVAAAVLAELAGAEGITCHIRGDRRHINERDLVRLRHAVSTPLNVEMAATTAMLRIARSVKPDLVTLVPETRGEITTEGGIDVARFSRRLRNHASALRRSKIRVSLFIDPDPLQIEAASSSAVDTIELNTNAYCTAKSARARSRAFDALVAAAAHATSSGLAVAAGHGLTHRNVRPVADIPGITELNIGHSIAARAMFIGFERAVTEILAAMS